MEVLKKVNFLKLPSKLNKKGQVLAVPKEVIFGMASIVVGLVFVYIFISQLYVGAPITPGSIEANSSDIVRRNYSGATVTFSGSFSTIATFAGLVVIVIMIALAWSYFKRSDMSGGTAGGSY